NFGSRNLSSLLQRRGETAAIAGVSLASCGGKWRGSAGIRLGSAPSARLTVRTADFAACESNSTLLGGRPSAGSVLRYDDHPQRGAIILQHPGPGVGIEATI